MNQYRKKVKTKNKYREFVRVLNGVLQLTEREIDVLSLLMKLDDTWPIQLSEHKNIISTDSRRTIMKETLINKSNLTKYIKYFKEKELLLEDPTDYYKINPIFMPTDLGGTTEILFTLDYKS